MNTRDQSDGKRPLWRAMLYGWLASLALAWLLLVAIDGLGITRMQAHNSLPIEAPFARSAAAWFSDIALLLGRLSLIAVLWAALFASIIWLAEQSGEKSLVAWLLAGLAATAPITMGFAIGVETGVNNPKPVLVFLVFSLYAIVPALVGAHVARRCRYPATWQ